MSTTERFEIESVSLSREERRGLFNMHQRTDHEWRDVWDEATSSIVARAVPLDEPICVECRERWGKEGCTTARALTLLSIHERTIQKNERRIAELTEALLPRFGAHRLREAGNPTVELRIWIDEHTIIYGKMDLVFAALRQMGDEFKKWLKDCGDLSRIRSDHLWALTIDQCENSRYAFLTQEFDPSAPFYKQPGAPWDEPAPSSPKSAVAPLSQVGQGEQTQ